MSKKNGPRSKKETVEAFSLLFDNIPSAETADEARQNLKEAGLDPDKLVADGLRRIRSSVENHPSYWRIRNREAIKSERAKLNAVEIPSGLSGERLREIVDLFIEKLIEVNPDLVPVKLHRGKSELSEGDLTKYLQELMFSAKKAGLEIDYGKQD